MVAHACSGLQLSTRRRPGGAHVALGGQLLGTNAAQLGHALSRLDGDGIRTVNLDLSDLSLVDSAGISELVRWHRHFTLRGVRFQVANAREAVLSILQVTNLTALFETGPCFENERETARRTRTAMLGSRDYIQHLLDGLGEGVLGLDNEGRILFLNPSAEKLLGWKEDALLGQPFAAIAQDGAGQYAPILETARGGRSTHRREHTLRDSNGAPLPVLVAATNIREGGVSIGAVVGLVDLTQRNQAQSALAQREASFERLYRNALVGLFRLDLATGRFIEANNRMAALLGLESGEALLEQERRRPPDPHRDGDPFAALLHALRTKGETHGVEFRLARAGRGSVCLRVGAVASPDGAFAEGAALDVTEEKHVEEERRRNEDNYRRLLKAVTNYTYAVEVRDGQAVKTVHSDGCLAVTGYTPGDFEASPMLTVQIVHDEDREAVVRYFQRIRRGERLPPFTYRIHQKSGALCWLRSTAAQNYGAEGAVTSYDVLVEDVTEHRLMEEQLRQAQKMEAVGQLAGGVAHDFNNLLTAIVGNVAIARMHGDGGAKVEKALEQAQKAAERASHLVRQLLVFSRKTEVETAPVDASLILRDVAAIVRKTFDRRIEIECLPGDEPPTVLGDASQIHQVLLNISLNARDALEELEPQERPERMRIELALQCEEIDERYCQTNPDAYPGRFAVVSVRDNGRGMPPAVRERIFEPFFTTKEPGRGTGLGLPSAFGIVKQHRGWITVASAPGRGSEFRVYLPATEERAANPETLDIAHTDLPTGTETVLLVDDEEMIRSLGQVILEGCGYAVLLAKDGMDALRVYNARKHEIDLLVLDVSMPLLSGLEVLKQIRATDPTVRAILSSGYSAPIAREHREVWNRTPFVAKPYRPADLATAVRDTLDA